MRPDPVDRYRTHLTPIGAFEARETQMQAMVSYIDSCRRERDRLLSQREAARYKTIRADGIDVEIKIESLLHVNGAIAALDRLIREFDEEPARGSPAPR